MKGKLYFSSAFLVILCTYISKIGWERGGARNVVSVVVCKCGYD